MKKLVFCIALLGCFLLSAAEVSPAMTRRVEALALGEVTLAYRLLSLSTSLAIANAADADAIVSLLDNVDNTISNGKTFLSGSAAAGAFTKEITELMSSLLACSKQIKEYAKTKNYDHLSKVRACIDPVEKKISELTERFNKTPAPTTTTPKEGEKK